jgi:uncharacterized membrane protein
MMLTILLIIDVLLIVSCAFIPYITRKTELFGVTLPAEKTDDPELVRLRASYRNQLLIGGVVLLVASVVAGLLVGFDSNGFVITWIVVMSLYLIGTFVLYLPKHRRMQAIKRERGWDTTPTPAVIVADTTPVTRDVISPAWLLLYLMVFVLTVLGILFVWPQVPEQIPLHFDIAGNVDSWATKGLNAVVPLLLTQVFIAVVFALSYAAIRISRRQIDAANPETSRQQSIRFRHAISVFLLVIGLICQLMIGFMQIVMLLGVQNIWAIMAPVFVLMAVILVATYFLMFRVGQGGSRLRTPALSPTRNANVDDDSRWILGLLYFNPADPALFVEQRFGVGFTLNFGRPLTWVISVTFIAVVVIVVAAIVILTK